MKWKTRQVSKFSRILGLTQTESALQCKNEGVILFVARYIDSSSPEIATQAANTISAVAKQSRNICK